MSMAVGRVSVVAIVMSAVVLLLQGCWGAQLSMEEDRPQAMATLRSANGLSAGAGVAADVLRLGTTMSLYAELRALALVTGRFTTTNGSLLLGFRWH